MARPDRHGENRKKNPEDTPRRAQQQEEAEQVEVEVEQKQTRDVAQDQLGNQGVAAMLGLSALKPGQAGVALENQERDEALATAFGDDDDLPPDGPLTLDDLVRSWNPSTRRGQDTVDATLGALQGLPPEDEALRDAVTRDDSPLALPASVHPDALVQPSAAVLEADLGAYVRQAARWSPSTPLHRLWAALLAPPAVILVDPDGRLVFTRARTSALAGMLVLDALGPADSDALSFVGFTLELSTCAGWIDRALDHVRAAEIRLPLAARVLAPLVEGLPTGVVMPRALPASASAHLAAIVRDLLALPPATALLPSRVAPAIEVEDDDPLGLDALVVDLTGAAPDPLAGLYEAAQQAAEKLAEAAVRLRVHTAGVLAAIARVCVTTSGSAPTAQLAAVADAFDREVARVFGLLVEIGRTVRARSVDPAGARNGLKRAARTLDALAADLPEQLGAIIGGALPPTGSVPSPRPAAPDDPLGTALDDDRPADAQPWLLAAPPSLDRDAALLLLALHTGAPPPEALLASAARARTADRAALAGALSLCAGVSALRGGALALASDLAATDLEIGLSRRNGTQIAAAALLGLEAHRLAGDEAAAAALRHRAVRLCEAIGARASASLLLRWRPPETDV